MMPKAERLITLENKRLLMLSNGKCHGQGHLEYAMPEITSFLGKKVKRVLFLPFARVAKPNQEPAAWDRYKVEVVQAFDQLGMTVDSLHRAERGERMTAIENAEAIFIGGGNAYYLLYWLYFYDLLKHLRAFVEQGRPLIGSSAGSNVLCQNIRGTNDDRIIDPPSMDAIGAVPFLLKPHFRDPDSYSTCVGKTHEQQVEEFQLLHDIPLIALRDRTWLRIERGRISPGGVTTARAFLRKGAEPRELDTNKDFEFITRPAAQTA